MRYTVLALVMLVGGFSSLHDAPPVQAQIPSIPGFGKTIETKFVPETAVLAVVGWPSELATKEKFDVFPREIVTAYGLKEFGFDPMLLKQATWLMGLPAGPGMPPNGAVLRFQQLQGLSDRVVRDRQQKQIGEYTLYAGGPNEQSFVVIDEVTILMGTESFLREMVQASGQGELVKLMRRPRVRGNVMAFANMEPVRPLVQQMAVALPPSMPPAVTDLTRLPEMITGIEFGTTVELHPEAEMVFHTVDDEQAEAAEKIIKNAVDMGKQMMIGSMAGQLDSGDPIQAATLKYVQRIANWYSESVAPTVDGNSLKLKMKNGEVLGPVLVGMLLPAVQSTRAAARRVASMNNARQAALALHNFADATRQLPAQANYDENGKPLLSWRVHILPYIEQGELYEQFRLDEPWDSPHNRKLISKMPQVYMSPSLGDLNGRTVYLGNAAEGGVFGRQPLRFQDIKDGLSNTALIVEVDESLAVEWTRPVDFEPGRGNPLNGLGQTHPGGFNVTMADGSVQFISRAIDPDIWKRMLSINDDRPNR